MSGKTEIRFGVTEKDGKPGFFVSTGSESVVLDMDMALLFKKRIGEMLPIRPGKSNMEIHGVEGAIEALPDSPNVYVGDSEVDGKGIFASRRIKKGELIGVYYGVRADVDSRFVLWITNNDTNEEIGIMGKNNMKYINHAPKPNAHFDSDHLYADRIIKKGEEIFFDYSGGEGVEFGEEEDEEEEVAKKKPRRSNKKNTKKVVDDGELEFE